MVSDEKFQILNQNSSTKDGKGIQNYDYSSYHLWTTPMNKARE